MEDNKSFSSFRYYLINDNELDLDHTPPSPLNYILMERKESCQLKFGRRQGSYSSFLFKITELAELAGFTHILCPRLKLDKYNILIYDYSFCKVLYLASSTLMQRTTNTFDVSQLDLFEPLGECCGREDPLQRVDGERVVAVGQAAELRLAVADGHR